MTRVRSVFSDLALLVARVVLGVVLIAHGWQKLSTNGMDATVASFEKMGVAMPEASAWYAALVELIGGGLLVLGAGTFLVGILVVADMIGALWFVHADQGVFVGKGGWELVALIGALALVLAFVGAGRLSVDGIFSGRRRRRETVVTTTATPAHTEPGATAI